MSSRQSARKKVDPDGEGSDGDILSDDEPLSILQKKGSSKKTAARKPTPKKQKRQSDPKGSFLTNLYEILDRSETDRSYSSIVSWEKDGTEFRIHKRKEFVSQAMPEYFNSPAYSNFQLQLRWYGFDRVGHDCFCHPQFTRSNRSQSVQIQRRRQMLPWSHEHANKQWSRARRSTSKMEEVSAETIIHASTVSPAEAAKRRRAQKNEKASVAKTSRKKNPPKAAAPKKRGPPKLRLPIETQKTPAKKRGKHEDDNGNSEDDEKKPSSVAKLPEEENEKSTVGAADSSRKEEAEESEEEADASQLKDDADSSSKEEAERPDEEEGELGKKRKSENNDDETRNVRSRVEEQQHSGTDERKSIFSYCSVM